jgi:uncharacterized protein
MLVAHGNVGRRGAQVLLENSFVVPGPIEQVWSHLIDFENVVVCIPGAEITEAIDNENYKGRMRIKLGAVSLTFSGTVTVVERDDADHRLSLQGSGTEQRGKGRASATVNVTVQESPEGTHVSVVQDLQVQGQIASMSRGLMGDVSARLTKQFARCLEDNINAQSSSE